MINHKTLANISIVLVRVVAGALLAFITTSYLARILGPTNNGIYALIILMPAMAVAFGGFGLGSAIVYIIGKDKYPISEIIAKLTFVSIVLSLIIVALLIILPEQLWAHLMPNVPMNLVLISLLQIPIIMLYTNLIGIIHGQQDFQKHGLLTLLPTCITLIFIVLASNFFDNMLMLAVVGWFTGYAITLIIVLYQFRYEFIKFFQYLTKKNNLIKETFGYGFKAYLGNLITFLNYRLSFYLIGAMVNAESIGIYAVTIPITEAIWLLSTAVSSVIFPLIANAPTATDRSSNPTPIISRWVFIVTAVAAVVIGISANFIITTAFGEPYSRAVVVLYCLLPGVVLFSVTKIISSDIAGRGKPQINLYLTFATLLANICLSFILIPAHGLIGAALAVSASYCFYTLIAGIVYSKMTQINIFELFIPRVNDFQIFKSALKI